MNYKRESTLGLSIGSIWMDLMGGTLSEAQLFVDWMGNSGTESFWKQLNWAKFLLGIVSIGFDLVFLWQHYLAYSSPADESEMEPSTGVIHGVTLEGEGERDPVQKVTRSNCVIFGDMKTKHMNIKDSKQHN